MKIVVINGSPKGKDGNTNVIADSFLKGARSAGAETVNIFLTEKEIKHCMGCHVCWTKGPGQCVTSDGAQEVLAAMGGADIIVFASPVYFGNISGMLKTFMDRMTMIGSPHTADNTEAGTEKEEKTGTEAEPSDQAAGLPDSGQQIGQPEPVIPKLMMISTCGFADRSEFDVTSLWIRKVSQKMNMELIGEIYATNGKELRMEYEKSNPHIADYLRTVETAGKEAAAYRKLTAGTRQLLDEIQSL